MSSKTSRVDCGFTFCLFVLWDAVQRARPPQHLIMPSHSGSGHAVAGRESAQPCISEAEAHRR
jgi:hypothetical protein